MEKWTYPKDYFGIDPQGYSILVAQNRDSNALTRSNFETISKEMKCINWDNDSMNSAPNVINIRQGHWACGWLELLLVKNNTKAYKKALEIEKQLDEYPVFDESHWSQLEWDEMADYWAGMDLQDRIDLCKEHEQSIFSARFDYIPDNCSLKDALRDC